jgi:DNA-binding NarL/FixJ family response regulator
MTSGLRILIADDHALLRKGLISALDDLGEEVEVCYEAENADQVMDALSMEPDLDLILLDLLMPGAKGFELLSKVCGESPGVPVVVLSASEDTGHMRKALDCGRIGLHLQVGRPRADAIGLGPRARWRCLCACRALTGGSAKG